MTDRIPLDHLTSDQYDQLCDELDALRQVARGYCPDCGRGDAAPTVADWETERRRADTAEWRRDDAERRVRCQRERAERAEAAVDLARQLHAQTCPLAQGAVGAGFTCSLCTALTAPARETP